MKLFYLTSLFSIVSCGYAMEILPEQGRFSLDCAPSAVTTPAVALKNFGDLGQVRTTWFNSTLSIQQLHEQMSLEVEKIKQCVTGDQPNFNIMIGAITIITGDKKTAKTFPLTRNISENEENTWHFQVFDSSTTSLKYQEGKELCHDIDSIPPSFLKMKEQLSYILLPTHSYEHYERALTKYWQKSLKHWRTQFEYQGKMVKNLLNHYAPELMQRFKSDLNLGIFGEHIKNLKKLVELREADANTYDPFKAWNIIKKASESARFIENFQEKMLNCACRTNSTTPLTHEIMEFYRTFWHSEQRILQFFKYIPDFLKDILQFTYLTYKQASKESPKIVLSLHARYGMCELCQLSLWGSLNYPGWASGSRHRPEDSFWIQTLQEITGIKAIRSEDFYILASFTEPYDGKYATQLTAPQPNVVNLMHIPAINNNNLSSSDNGKVER